MEKLKKRYIGLMFMIAIGVFFMLSGGQNIIINQAAECNGYYINEVHTENGSLYVNYSQFGGQILECEG